MSKHTEAARSKFSSASRLVATSPVYSEAKEQGKGLELKEVKWSDSDDSGRSGRCLVWIRSGERDVGIGILEFDGPDYSPITTLFFGAVSEGPNQPGLHVDLFAGNRLKTEVQKRSAGHSLRNTVYINDEPHLDGIGRILGFGTSGGVRGLSFVSAALDHPCDDASIRRSLIVIDDYVIDLVVVDQIEGVGGDIEGVGGDEKQLRFTAVYNGDGPMQLDGLEEVESADSTKSDGPFGFERCGTAATGFSAIWKSGSDPVMKMKMKMVGNSSDNASSTIYRNGKGNLVAVEKTDQKSGDEVSFAALWELGHSRASSPPMDKSEALSPSWDGRTMIVSAPDQTHYLTIAPSEGEFVLVRARGDAVVQVTAFGSRKVTLNEKVLVECDLPLAGVDIVFADNLVMVEAPEGTGRMTILTSTATGVVLNGQELSEELWQRDGDYIVITPRQKLVGAPSEGRPPLAYIGQHNLIWVDVWNYSDEASDLSVYVDFVEGSEEQIAAQAITREPGPSIVPTQPDLPELVELPQIEEPPAGNWLSRGGTRGVHLWPGKRAVLGLDVSVPSETKPGYHPAVLHVNESEFPIWIALMEPVEMRADIVGGDVVEVVVWNRRAYPSDIEIVIRPPKGWSVEGKPFEEFRLEEQERKELRFELKGGSASSEDANTLRVYVVSHRFTRSISFDMNAVQATLP